MPASDELAAQFNVVFQGQSPLPNYPHDAVQRYGVVDTELAAQPAPEPVMHKIGSARSVRESDYWNPRVVIGSKDRGGRLKEPKVFKNPSAAAPGTVSFADVTPLGDDV